MNKVASADLIPGPKRSGVRQKERAKTTSTVLRSTLNGVIWLIAIFMILAEFGLNLGPLIASAGVIGVALGLGAQTLVRDILSGIFMLVEDQYGAVTGMSFIKTGVEGRSFGAQYQGIAGDTFIGAFTFVKKGYVSDKVGDTFPKSERDRTVCDSPNDLLLQQMELDWYNLEL